MEPLFTTGRKTSLEEEEVVEPEFIKERRVEVLEDMPTAGDTREKRDTDEIAKKAKQTHWMTREMAEDFGRQDVLFSTFKEAMFYLVFVIAVTMCTIGRRSSSMFYITQALKGQFLQVKFVKAGATTKFTFEKIHTASDFWAYTEQIMVDTFYVVRTQNPFGMHEKLDEEDHRILFENKLLGVPRLRQVRVQNNTCKVHKYFTKLFKNCYALYSDETESKESFGPRNGTAWKYNSPKETKSVKYEGSITTYGAGGFYQDLATKKNGTLPILARLKRNLWIGRATRAIFLDFSLYNANLNLFCICKLLFEFLPSGGIRPSHMFQAVELFPFVDSWDYIAFGAECVMYIMTVYFVLEEFRELMYFKFRYVFQFWTYIDWIIIGGVMGNLVISQLIFPDPNIVIEEIKKHPEKYGNLEQLGEIKFLQNNFAAILLFFTYIKLFKYINFNKTMGQLNNTLKRCAFDLLGFSIMFFIIFFAYAELGYLIFGTHVEDFRTFGVAMFTLLRTMLGDFDYFAIERASRFLAPIYFLSYIFFVFFVLLNMFLAIINDTYADVKTEIAITADEMQMAEYLKKSFFKLLQKCGCKFKFKQEEEANTTTQKIREALKKCEFSDLEIEMFFARYNIDPLAEVGDYDVRKIMKDLEDQSFAKAKLDEDTTLLHMEDFQKQQERVAQMESIISDLKGNIENLIRKLEAFESARKTAAKP